MFFQPTYLPYRDTGSFTRFIIDYLEQAPALRGFYSHPVNVDGINQAIVERKKFRTDRSILVQQLKLQYSSYIQHSSILASIESLTDENTFTVCTAHQPNIFTGHLYFIYKIIHAIRLADELKKELPQYNFIPVYYMGTEDADLYELGQIEIDQKKYTWKTDQTGAVGRMKIDKAFIALIEEIESQLSVAPFGNEIISLVKKSYTAGKTLEQSTFEFVHELFGEYGLVILLPDNAALKKQFQDVNEKELREQFSHRLVMETLAAFPKEYKAQAAGREINLFYLKDNIRERIEKIDNRYPITNTDISLTEEELKKELIDHPERFSPNVILRPVIQEMILPNIAFIGGSGELAYWLELKKVFEAVHVPFPVLILRNSFLIINDKMAVLMKKLHLKIEDLFKKENELIAAIVTRQSQLQLELSNERESLSELYTKIDGSASAVNKTLSQHVEALKTQALKKILQLEKKMLRAEKQKFEAEQRQLKKILGTLFPGGGLQERVDNLLPYYAGYGKEFIKMIYENSKGLEQQFCVLEDNTQS